MIGRPPRWAQSLVRVVPLGAQREEVEGDLIELFASRAATVGRTAAILRYCVDALSLWRRVRPHLTRQPSRRSFHMWQDIVFAGRLFRRQPALFCMAIVGLGAAIGLSTIVFSVVNAFVFSGAGVPDEQAVRRVWNDGSAGPTTGNSAFQGNWAFADYSRLAKDSTTMTLAAAAEDGSVLGAVPGSAESRAARGMAVTGNYFPVLRTQASLGRLLTPADDVPDQRSIVISQGFWKNRLGGDPGILGKTVWLADEPFIVVGVAPRDVLDANGGTGNPPAYWITLSAHERRWNMQSTARREVALQTLRDLKKSATTPATIETLRALETDLSVPERAWNPAVFVTGRFQSGVVEARAATELNAAAEALLPPSQRPPRGAAVTLHPIASAARDSFTLAAIVLVIVGMIVALACANITNLLLASASTRRREIGTRLALGADRRRIARQLLTESLMLSMIAGAVGFGAALLIAPALAGFVLVPPSVDISADLRVYLFAASLTIVVGLLAGLAPARFGRRGDVLSSLKTDQNAAPSPFLRSRLRSVLVGGQASISIVLLVLSSLLARSLVRSLTIDPGFDPSRIVAADVGNSSHGRAWSPERRASFWHRVLEETRQLPGVESAATATLVPFGGISFPRTASGLTLNKNETSTDFFDMLGIRVIHGRTFNAGEVEVDAPVAVISQELARQYWGNDDPIGATLERVVGANDRLRRYQGAQRTAAGTRIIGVVSDVTYQLNTPNAATIYVPLNPWSVPKLVARVTSNPRALSRPIEALMERVEPGVGPNMRLPIDGLERDLQGPKILSAIGGIVATLALALATLGLFGVTAFVVNQRRHEVSVRRTLGATEVEMVAMLVRQSLRPVVIGLAVGLVAAVAGGHVIQVVLAGISGHDLIAIAGAVIVLLGTAITAVLLPARRVASTNPAEILKA